MSPEITGMFEIAKLDLQPGDTLVVKSATPLSMEQATRLRDIVRRYIPDDCEVVVLDAGISLEVLRK